MSEFTVDAAAASLGQIIDELSAGGQPVVLTRDGAPVARISLPIEPSPRVVDPLARRRFLKQLSHLRRRVKPLTDEEIVTTVQEGRPAR